MTRKIKLGNKVVTSNSDPYIIAEVGVNHESNMDTAKLQIQLAKEGGADAVKFQSYKAEKLASINSPAYWDTKLESTQSQFELFKKYDSFNENDYLKLAEFCKANEIEFISTPFDDEAVDYLDPIVDFFKVASADITNFPLLKKIASKSKPILLSTGASNIDEIKSAIQIIEDNGCENIAILHCILNYPTHNSNANLRMINFLKDEFESRIIGYSDHTLPEPSLEILKTAYVLGAVIIEKHFTHDKSLKGNDHYHAMDKNDLRRFKKEIENINYILGSYDKKEPIPTEEISRINARRSLVLKRKLNKNDIIEENNLICKRPGNGISPSDLHKIIGKKVKKDLLEDHIITWKDIADLAN